MEKIRVHRLLQSCLPNFHAGRDWTVFHAFPVDKV
jgi:hypothetical protein